MCGQTSSAIPGTERDESAGQDQAPVPASARRAGGTGPARRRRGGRAAHGPIRCPGHADEVARFRGGLGYQQVHAARGLRCGAAPVDRACRRGWTRGSSPCSPRRRLAAMSYVDPQGQLMRGRACGAEHRNHGGALRQLHLLPGPRSSDRKWVAAMLATSAVAAVSSPRPGGGRIRRCRSSSSWTPVPWQVHPRRAPRCAAPGREERGA